ncbi:hypothetical protein [Amycolatopsis xylanica]|uniref:hypothetical protein n=1 Tax=Amycolatopsis xylanica TaxID=589385 RepID=UPI00115F80E3|nr:hypothetical protein [Amycolatopsis xylanica]
MMRIRLVVAAAVALSLTACGSADGDARTDRQATTLAEAISDPSQVDAAAYVRAALATNLGKSAAFSVLVAEDLAHKDVKDPAVRLVWRIHEDVSDTDWSRSSALDACYRAEFGYHGLTSAPERVTCPEHAVPITPPPVPRRDIPETFAPALEALLGKLPPAPSEAEVRGAVAAGLVPPVDPETRLAAVPPEVFVQVRGADVGVALYAHTGIKDTQCLMGRRAAGEVSVWSLGAREQEFPCGAEAALAGRRVG